MDLRTGVEEGGVCVYSLCEMYVREVDEGR